ncbi:hypothetical protein AIOL_003791 [Candidatus Rhodobacter oscarellae]|uniref:SRPBCC family protein n=1 Tax=Candidatus Rhodobacter oscarellae TaxID=1675527 RepID=A0A0J9E7V4_9RHOB|nr:SRPBCC family protein [Candidatus Rhodobacter lobularis]KMW58811.1 hypothetical protein AIOL_003791 [Candidatus Rhodobacter lobularis]
MTSKNTVTVKASAEAAWKLIGEDFVRVDRWMAAIPRAEPIPGPALPGAPARGRYSYLIKKFEPIYQEEVLTSYDPANTTISVDVTLHNLGRLVPMRGYTATVIIKTIDAANCTVTWIGDATPKWFGKLMRGQLTKGLDAGFIRSLEEIQHMLETGEPHPRKIEKIKSEAALAAA